MAENPNEQLALLPHLTYGELDELRTAVASRRRVLSEVSRLAKSDKLKRRCGESVPVLRSLETAISETMSGIRRVHAGE